MKCEIIRDLLPAYCDGVCSPESSAEIEQHTAECPDCAKLMADFKSEITTPEAEVSAPKKPFKKIKKSIFRNKLVIALLVILLIPIGYLTYGQIIRNTYVFSFETIISSFKAKALATKIIEGDTDYVMDKIAIQDVAMEFYLENDGIKENCCAVIEEYSKIVKDKNPRITSWMCIYSDPMNERISIPSTIITIEADGLPDVNFCLFEIGGRFILKTMLSDYTQYSLPDNREFYDFITGRMDFAFNPYSSIISYEKAVLDGTASHESIYQKISSSYSDGTTPNPEYEKALAERFAAIDAAGIVCEHYSFDNLRFDSESGRFLAEIHAIFIDTNGKPVIYDRTIHVFHGNGFAILPEYVPEIIDGGVTPETREMIENLF